MSLFFQVLASGSKGNSIVVCSSKTRVLFDSGLSCKEIVRRLEKTPVNGKDLDALVISHEHQDHSRGCGVISRRFDLPVYLTRGTLENLPPQVGQLAYSQVFQTGASFTIGDLKIHPFAVSHDAGEPSAFVIEQGSICMGICTDLGMVTQLVKIRLQQCQALVIESNHDVTRLMEGPYPLHLKQRIRSRHGHLSNEEAIELLKDLHHEGLKSVLFAHLSETNNHPDLVRRGFQKLSLCQEWEGVRFEIGKQNEVSTGIELA
ncbi:MAG: MBL fold metallo-hydrolase [Deltaproteobacteria bacterium]|nr:MBL fold metallo-hydrolase [Deltaproteobacteria bacterium]